MAKAAILAVDDDRAVLNAVERDLRQKYGRDYRILKADSGSVALDSLKQLLERGEAVALLLVDQRMPQMTGTQFLAEALKLYPEAKKVLLTAYADTEAAIMGINTVGLDYYLMKPWDPPQENLYPVLDDLLDTWKAEAHLPFEGIRMIGSLWSPGCHTIKEFLVRHQIPYHWIDFDTQPAARTLADKIPTLVFPDGTRLVDPSTRELAEKLGLATRAAMPSYDTVIIGGGPSGLAASVYGSSDGLKVLLIEKEAPGGQAGTSPKIENYLGFPSGISGGELTRRAMAQARRFGAEVLTTQAATRIRIQDQYKIVTLADGSEVSCQTVIIATGATFNILDLPGTRELGGAGIYYGAAHTEAVYYRDQDVVVVGGANSAGQGAMFLSRYARKVTVLIRGSEPSASKYLVDAMNENPKIEILTNTELVRINGKEGKLEEIVICNTRTNSTESRPAAAIFVFIGVNPQSDFVADLVMRDDKGYILTGRDLMKEGKPPPGWTLNREPLLLETNVPGVFAAGDVRHGTNHRVASAAGDGALAVALIWEYMKTV